MSDSVIQELGWTWLLSGSATFIHSCYSRWFFNMFSFDTLSLQRLNLDFDNTPTYSILAWISEVWNVASHRLNFNHFRNKIRPKTPVHHVVKCDCDWANSRMHSRLPYTFCPPWGQNDPAWADCYLKHIAVTLFYCQPVLCSTFSHISVQSIATIVSL